MARNVVVTLACLLLVADAGCGSGAAKAKTAETQPSASAVASSVAAPNPDALPPELASLVGELDKGPPGDAARTREITSQIAQSGNAIAVREATKRILAMATRIGTPDWREAHKTEVKSASERHGVVLSDPQLEMKVIDWQNDRLIPIVDAMGNLGGDPIIDWAFHEAEDKTLPLERRQASVKLLSRLVTASDPRASRLAPLTADMDKLSASQDTAHDSANDVQQVIAGLTGEFRKCSDKAMKKNPKLDVNGSLELKVGGDGVVTSSQAKEVSPADLATCVEKAGQAAHFAAPKSGRPFTLRLPLVFRTIPAS